MAQQKTCEFGNPKLPTWCLGQHERHGIIPRFTTPDTTSGLHRLIHGNGRNLISASCWLSTSVYHSVRSLGTTCWMSVASSHWFKAQAPQDLIWFSFCNWLALLFWGCDSHLTELTSSTANGRFVDTNTGWARFRAIWLYAFKRCTFICCHPQHHGSVLNR